MARDSRNRKTKRYVHPLEMGAKTVGSTVDIAGMRERIAELEEMLAAAPYLERKRREAMRDWIMPEEETTPRARGNTRRLTKQEQQALARERRGHIFISLGLLIMLIGLLNWLAQLLRA